MRSQRLLVACGAFAAGVACAQPTAVVPAPALRYESAFAGYRPMDDAGPGDWKQLNDRLRESATRQSHGMPHGSMPPKPPVAAPTATQSDHAGHAGGKK